MIDTGVRLQLLIGGVIARPAPPEVIDALRSVEVQSYDNDRDGFQIELAVGSGTSAEYSILSENHLSVDTRVIVTVIFQGTPHVLIDGIVVDHQLSPSSTPGDTRLVVSGVDLTERMNQEARQRPYVNQSDSTIAETILRRYADLGVQPNVIPTPDTPSDTQRTPSQNKTDFAYLKELAQRNSYLFYLEPITPGTTLAYFGPDTRATEEQPALSVNMGPDTNIDQPLYFRYDSRTATTPVVTILDRLTGEPVEVPAPPQPQASLSAQPAQSYRKVVEQAVARLTLAQARLVSLAAASRGADSVTVSGELDTVRYGYVLRTRRRVPVRGVGRSYGGDYSVRQVTHRIRRGEYRQSFTLSREGLTATGPTVRTS